MGDWCKEHHGKVTHAVRYLPWTPTISNTHRRLQARAYSGYFESCIFVSWGQDAKTRGHQHIAYVCTDVCSVVINTCSVIVHQCGIGKSCPGTHTALQVPMITRDECFAYCATPLFQTPEMKTSQYLRYSCWTCRDFQTVTWILKWVHSYLDTFCLNVYGFTRNSNCISTTNFYYQY